MNSEKIGEKHISVLLEELVNSVVIFKKEKNIIVDSTLGMAGHAIHIIEKMNKGDIFIGFDADDRNLKLAKERLKNVRNDVEIIFINSNFVNLKEELLNRGINEITGIYYDLGLSSLHVDEAERGFSFKLDGPLDMRFDIKSGKSAEHIINHYSKDDLLRIFRDYGEEASSRKIADKIVERRKVKRITTTKELSDIIGEISKFPKSKNRIFQALRIETNKELENLEKSLKDSVSLLKEKGSIFVISFHSLEDRIVKNVFKNESRSCNCKDLICSCKKTSLIKIITKKPIIPTNEEIERNPRSRSAKARFAIKIKS